MTSISNNDNLTCAAYFLTQTMQITVEFVIYKMVLSFVLAFGEGELRIVGNPCLIEAVFLVAVEVRYLLSVTGKMDIDIVT